jgi:hypothetical protein
MVLSHFANKFGIWDLIAPTAKREGASSSRQRKKQRNQQQEQEKRDEELAMKLQKEEEIRFQQLKAQHDNEERAKAINQYAKKQRVSYFSKMDDEWIDAVVVGVHFDDGPDHPYYVSGCLHV